MTDTHPTTSDTAAPAYGRCPECQEIKQVTPHGAVQAHNAYRADGTALVVLRCPGSDARPVDAA